ncbi:MAG: hypothetical protein UHD09_06305 [Bifidobacterium sp.]|nr:hypothetical protein [Bifidobacterium sp.]
MGLDEVIDRLVEGTELPRGMYGPPLHRQGHWAWASVQPGYHDFVEVSDTFRVVDVDTGRIDHAYCGPMSGCEPVMPDESLPGLAAGK